MHRLSNKRITRLQSDIELSDCEYQARLINRNPRNLEQLSFDKKPTGYWLDKSPPNYWNRLRFEQQENCLLAYLEHWSGKLILKASTSEERLLKYFKSPTSLDAANLLAKIFARRCMQAGYLCVGIAERDELNQSVKKRHFFKSLVEHGLRLEESPEIVPRTVADL